MTACLTSLPKKCRDRVYQEIPGGTLDCVNIDYSTAFEFVEETLLIRLDGVTLDPSQYTVGGDFQSFTLIVDVDDANALNAPPGPSEVLTVDYDKAPSTKCMIIL